MVCLLPRTPEPAQNEGILGLVLRTAERNGYESPWHVFRLAGYAQGQMITAAFKVDRLARILGKEAEILAKHAYLGVGGDDKPQFQLNGVPLGRNLHIRPLNLDRPRICVACVEADGVTDMCWDLSSFVACPVHGQLLLRTCPGCDKPLSWFRPGLLACACGTSFRGAATKSADEQTLALMSIIRRKVRARDEPVECEPRGGLPMEHLSGLSLRMLLFSIFVLQNLDPAERGIEDSQLSAAEVFGNWPRGLHSYLRRIDQKAASAGARGCGLRKRFSSFYHALLRPRRGFEPIRFIRTEFIRFGLTEWGEGVVDIKLMRDCQPQAERFVATTALARKLGIMPITARRWLDAGAIPAKAVDTGEGQHRYVADAAGLACFPSYRDGRVDAREAGRISGMPVSVLMALKTSGHFSTNQISNVRVGFWRADLEALDARLLAIASRLEEFPGGQPHEADSLVNLRRLMQVWKLGGTEVKGALVAAIMEGEIQPLGRDGDGALDMVLRTSDVEAFRVQYAIRSKREDLTATAAAEMLGITAHSIPALIDAGVLQRKNGDCGRISRSSVESFSVQWMPLSVLANQMKTSSAALRRRAEEIGLKILRLPAVGDRLIPFVSQSDKARLLG